MKWTLWLLVALGCQRGDASAPQIESPAYQKDIASLCDAIKLSGADKIEPEARQLTIANWLAANFKTEAAHQFLVRIQPLQGDAKADALVAEAKRIGLPGCALASEWRTPR